LKVFSSGAAPLSTKVIDFLRIALSSEFSEGYGLTETCCIVSSSCDGDLQFGHVGLPVSCVECKLVDVPDMNYLTTDSPCPRGEIWVRGSNVFKGYYKQPEITAECLTEDGWFATGDVGAWQPDGNLRIIDRKKNIFKLSQGEYIRPEYIEVIYKQNKYIANSFVYGDSFQNYLVAIVVPNFEYLNAWAKQNNIVAKTNEDLIKNPAANKFILSQMDQTGKQENLNGFEHAKKITLVSEDFSAENGLLTPSLKLKRHEAKIRFANQIKALYEDNSNIKAKL